MLKSCHGDTAQSVVPRKFHIPLVRVYTLNLGIFVSFKLCSLLKLCWRFLPFVRIFRSACERCRRGPIARLDHGQHTAITGSMLGILYTFWGMGFLIFIKKGSFFLPGVMWAKIMHSYFRTVCPEMRSCSI